MEYEIFNILLQISVTILIETCKHWNLIQGQKWKVWVKWMTWLIHKITWECKNDEISILFSDRFPSLGSTGCSYTIFGHHCCHRSGDIPRFLFSTFWFRLKTFQAAIISRASTLPSSFLYHIALLSTVFSSILVSSILNDANFPLLQLNHLSHDSSR